MIVYCTIFKNKEKIIKLKFSIMAHLIGLENMKVTKSTVTKIRTFVFENKGELSNEMKLFYADVASIIERNVAKPRGTWHKITDIKEVLERAYNIESYVLATGAASYSVEFENVEME